MPNHLAGATSPYLLQHAGNPVDWYPWGSEALERARREDRVILLSVGYAACHWCHVMAHESFEDQTTARIMNEHFVNVKVDREERPDIDAIYMQAVQAMTGQGGWPMTVFLTPDGAPFYGGTYFPPTDRHGLPSFRRVLAAVSDAWQNRRGALEDTARQLREIVQGASRLPAAAGRIDAGLLADAVTAFERSFDPRNGGFGGAPKFPPSMALDFLLRRGVRTESSEALSIVIRTFEAMARGGIFDQVGGGLHRYSVDERWIVPHFEKMLYDNALFARLGVHLWQATGDPLVREAAVATLDWALREMRAPDGGFHSSLDADSEGGEGTFYLWDVPELDAVLGEEAGLAKAYWGVTAQGNFEGRNILSVPLPASVVAEREGLAESTLHERIARARAALLEARGGRQRPSTDDKVVAAWNGLMVRALSEAARVFDRADYRDAAESTGSFLAGRMCPDGRAHRSWRDGTLSVQGFLEDQAAVGLAFLDLYSLTFDAGWVDRADALTRGIVEHFMQEGSPLPFDTAADHETLLARPRDVSDNAVPSGVSLTAELFVRLADLTDDESLRRRGEAIAAALGDAMRTHPAAFGHLLGTTDMLVAGTVQVAIVGDPAAAETLAMTEVVRRHYVPALVLAGGAPNDAPDTVALLRGRTARSAGATAYVCRHFVCDEPSGDPETLSRQLERAVHEVG